MPSAMRCPLQEAIESRDRRVPTSRDTMFELFRRTEILRIAGTIMRMRSSSLRKNEPHRRTKNFLKASCKARLSQMGMMRLKTAKRGFLRCFFPAKRMPPLVEETEREWFSDALREGAAKKSGVGCQPAKIGGLDSASHSFHSRSMLRGAFRNSHLKGKG